MQSLEPQSHHDVPLVGKSYGSVCKTQGNRIASGIQFFLSGLSALAYQIISFKLIQASGLGDALSIAISLTAFVTIAGVGAILANKISSGYSGVVEVLMGIYGSATFIVVEVAGLSWYIEAIHEISYPARVAALIALLAPLSLLGGMLIPLAEKRQKVFAQNIDAFSNFGNPYLFFHIGGSLCLISMELFLFGRYGWTTVGIAVSVVAIANGTAITANTWKKTKTKESSMAKRNLPLNLSITLLCISVATGYGGIVTYKAFDYLVGPNIRNYTYVTSCIFLALGASAWIVSKISISSKGVLGAAGLGLAFIALPAGILPAFYTEAIHSGFSFWLVYPISAIGLILPVFVLFGISVPAFVKAGLNAGEVLCISSIGNAIGYWLFTTTAIYNADALFIAIAALVIVFHTTWKWALSIFLTFSLSGLILYPYYFPATHQLYLAKRTVAEEMAVQKALARSNSHLTENTLEDDIENATWDFSVLKSWATRGWTVDHIKVFASKNGEELYSSETLNIGGYTSLAVDSGSSTKAYESLSAAIPAMYSNKQTAMVLGAGTGVSAEFLSRQYKSLDIVDISQDANQQVNHFSYLHGGNGLNDDMILEEDAISHISSYKENSYDLIFSTLSGSGYAFSAMLYTKEFFNLAKRNLAPGGTFAFWVSGSFGIEEGLPAISEAMNETFSFVKRIKIRPGDTGSSDIVYQAFIGSDEPLSVQEKNNDHLLASLSETLKNAGEGRHILANATNVSLAVDLESLEDRNPFPVVPGGGPAEMKRLSFAYDHSPHWASFSRIMKYLSEH